ncbi:MAG: AbrB/MazE/SpoVT family DNA-binding domain-containing protein [Pseudomonadota bacterium]|nr:AbrB/MazE/SpoVT family DNA-binding domain-containing protein [Pseudomonadota bacterium]
MTATLKLRRHGNSLGFTVPQEICEHLNVREGDSVHVVAEPGGTLRITPFDPAFDRALKAYERTRRKYRNTLRALAD